MEYYLAIKHEQDGFKETWKDFYEQMPSEVSRTVYIIKIVKSNNFESLNNSDHSVTSHDSRGPMMKHIIIYVLIGR